MMEVKIKHKMRIFILLVVLAVMSSFQLLAQEQADSVTVESLPMFDKARSGKYVINAINVLGVEHFDSEIVAFNSGMMKGDTVVLPGNYITDAVKKLWGQGYFSDIKSVVEYLDGDRINIELYVKERPRVTKWKFEGAKKGEISSLEDDLDLKIGGELSDFIIKNNTDYIIKFYKEKGFLNVNVDLIQKESTIIENGIDITFKIDRGDKVKIGEINFEGNVELTNKQLESSLKKTKDKHIFNMFKSSKLNQEDYEADKLNLIDFYNSKGYRNAMVVKDSIYTINDKRIGINITVEEGNKYYYRNIDWIGNSKYDTETLGRMMGISSGDTYDRRTILKRLGIGAESNPDEMSVSSLYQNDGHLFFQVEPTETIIGTDSIDIEFKVLEGKQARINNVDISGNKRVNDDVIRRDLSVRPGDLYNRSLLMSTMRQLSQMGHFNPEVMQPDINPISDELVNISFPLEEQASDQFEVSGGWGSGMFVGSVGIQLNNISLRNFFKKGEWRPYPAGQNQKLSISGQTNGSYYKAFTLGFTEPWLGGKKPNSLSVNLYFSQESDAYYFYQSSTQYFRTLGAAVGLGRRLKWPDQYFSIYNEIGYKCYDLDDWDYFIIENGSSNVITFKTTIQRNSIDQPIYPRRGTSFSGTLTFTPPYSLIDGKDYSDDDMEDEERYKWVEFHKWQFSAQWFYPMLTNQNLVFMAKAEFGVLGSYNKDKLSPYEGFDVGGDGMTSYSVYGVDVIGLRGYESSALNPYSVTGDYARAYNKYTAELRYPIILQPSSTIYGLVFAEAGNAYVNWKDFSPLNVKRSLGAGIRMYLPIVGMIGVDWAYGFDCPVGDTSVSGNQIHFTMGTSF